MNEYTHCAHCGQPLQIEKYEGFASLDTTVTCRNPHCATEGQTLAPERHRNLTQAELVLYQEAKARFRESIKRADEMIRARGGHPNENQTCNI
jgi:recombinational DNA repair protein (RecF pathway)